MRPRHDAPPTRRNSRRQIPPRTITKPGAQADRPADDERGQRDAVNRNREHRLQPVHLVHVGHPGDRQGGQHHDAHPSTEVAAVGGDDQLEGQRPQRHVYVLMLPADSGARPEVDGRPGHSLRIAGVGRTPALPRHDRAHRRHAAAERKCHCRHQHQPRQQAHEALVRRAHEEQPAQQPARPG